ncbi:head decoration protein [Methylobacterium sp. yr668]|uniref:head decoration protein n=1 Tax=Methylobacterium sp. yr668 TaxID=1761801 RepID=UPI0008EE8B05|nr:head decoration protein [Methylobacterium sp. yr668]SFT11708.1 Bacteriophage lambda head decoration protein D [Methylobacterium sp. yr668]
MGTNNVVASYDPTALFAGAFPVRQRVVTLASGANLAGAPLKRGALLGRVTATDKYILSVATASDGSQVPAAILAADTDASAADVKTPAYFEGEFAGEIMQIDASWSIAAVQAALRQANSHLYVRSVGTLG